MRSAARVGCGPRRSRPSPNGLSRSASCGNDGSTISSDISPATRQRTSKMLSTNTASAGFAIDEAAHTIRFVRELDAPPARVFAAWTEPEQVAQWWDAMGERLAVCEIDLRPGGAFRFTTGHHPDKPFTGVYQEIAPPTLLVFEANGATGKVMLAELAGGTRMTVEIVCRSPEHLAQFVAMGVAAGTSRTLDNLASHLRRA